MDENLRHPRVAVNTPIHKAALKKSSAPRLSSAVTQFSPSFDEASSLRSFISTSRYLGTHIEDDTFRSSGGCELVFFRKENGVHANQQSFKFSEGQNSKTFGENFSCCIINQNGSYKGVKKQGKFAAGLQMLVQNLEDNNLNF